MKRSRISWLVGLALTTALVVTAGIAGFAGSGAAAGDATLTPPTVQAPPTISGTPERGSTLTTSNGTWNGTAPITYRYQWLRCDPTGGSCSNIGGATERTYELKNPDVGNTLRARVTATNSDGSASSTAVPTAVIRQEAAPAPVGCGGNAPIPIASISPPERLIVDRQSINPPVVGGSTQSLTVRFHVSCRGKSVQGALVYATAVPFNQFSVPAEQATGADGWAELRLNRLRGYPAARNQQLLVFFARARKSGEDLLGGVSSRRLVSFPVNLSR